MNNRGISSVITLAVAIVILLVTFVLYYASQSGSDYSNLLKSNSTKERETLTDTIPQDSEEDISYFDDEETLSNELDATIVGDPTNDLNSLDQLIAN